MHTPQYWRAGLLLGALLLLLAPGAAAAAEPSEESSPAQASAARPTRATSSETPPFRRHSLGSSLFVLANVIPMEDSPSFYQLNYQYRVTPRDVLSLELLTWKYHAPLGIPYGRSWGDRSENYPGFVRAFGFALVYKRFIWRGIYAALHAANLYQIYNDENGAKIQTGYQLFLTLRAGYHFAFFNDRVFVEPSIAMTAWPVNTNLPEAFRVKEDKWPGYFLGEAGLHFGVSF